MPRLRTQEDKELERKFIAMCMVKRMLGEEMDCNYCKHFNTGSPWCAKYQTGERIPAYPQSTNCPNFTPGLCTHDPAFKREQLLRLEAHEAPD